MMQKPIKLAQAKNELVRINEILDSPLILIGGLAVQQYHVARDSYDIDLVCEHATAMKILHELYPSIDWSYEDRNQDEYRPEFVIKHKVHANYPALRFGPKITERQPYSFIQWEELSIEARKFSYKDKILDNILVPSIEKLCLMKFASYLGRSRNSTEKILQDLRDIIVLSNHNNFRLGEFYNLTRRWKIGDEIKRAFRDLPDMHDREFSSSYLRGVTNLFSPMLPEVSSMVVWVIGSVTDLPDNERDWAYKVTDALADAFISRSYRVVMGRSQMLDYMADRIAIGQVDPSAVRSNIGNLSTLFASKSARSHNECPNPVILLGSLRSARGIRNIFIDSIGRVPDVGIVIGGSVNGRADEETQLAMQAGIPLLPLPLTGGLAARISGTLDASLREKVDKVQAMARGSDVIGSLVCDLIEAQTQLRRIPIGQK